MKLITYGKSGNGVAHLVLGTTFHNKQMISRNVITQGFGVLVPMLTLLSTFELVYLMNFKNFTPTCLSVWNLSYVSSLSWKLRLSHLITCYLSWGVPEKFLGGSDFKTSASVWISLKIYWIKCLCNDLFPFLDVNKIYLVTIELLFFHMRYTCRTYM